MIDKKFMLFQCCMPVKGAFQGVIIDFQRKTLHSVSNQMIDIINEYSDKSIYEIFADFRDYKSLLKKYIRYFIDNELIIVYENLSSFIPISTNFVKPYLVDTVSIEIDTIDTHMRNFFKEIDIYGVVSIKFIIRNNIVENVLEVLKLLDNSKIQCVSFFVEFSKSNIIEFESIVKANPRIEEIIFFNSSVNNKFYYSNLNFEKDDVEQILYKSVKGENHFILDINFFNESLGANSIYNKSIFIDKNLNVKNHIKDNTIFGNLTIDSLENIITNGKITDFWKISKDRIQVCKDCQYRYICPDGSIPINVDNDIENYKYQNVCNYNPYENFWKS